MASRWSNHPSRADDGAEAKSRDVESGGRVWRKVGLRIERGRGEAKQNGSESREWVALRQHQGGLELREASFLPAGANFRGWCSVRPLTMLATALHCAGLSTVVYRGLQSAVSVHGRQEGTLKDRYVPASALHNRCYASSHSEPFETNQSLSPVLKISGG